MTKYAINPNVLPDPLAEERAAIARDHAFVEDSDAEATRPAAPNQPLPPMMSPLPDPRFPHGDVDAIEQRLAEIKAANARLASAPSPARTSGAAPPVAHEKAAAHPLIASLMATLPEPGSVWSARERADWLLAAEGIFHLVYKADARLNVEADAA